jgi:predicted DNA-binding transcriptional regulator AlpA
VTIEPETDLLDADAVCRFLGGSRPINAATLYRGIKAGRYPKPIKVGPNSSRWLRADLEAALNAIIGERDDKEETA